VALHFIGTKPAAVARTVGLVSDHSLGEQPLEGLSNADLPEPFQRSGPEASVEQVQDRMLDAADILGDRKPLLGFGPIERPVGGLAGEADEVPARIHESVERVGLARRLAFASRTGHMLPGRMAVERVARLVELDVVGKDDRKVLARDWNRAAFGAVDNRDRCSPVTLA